MDVKMLKNQSSDKKKKLIRTRRESNRLKIITTVTILVVVFVIYFLIDSGSYVATVDGNRISKTEYQFFLSRQQTATEQQEGIYGKSDAEKEAFWLKTADGQNPWETVKSRALDSAKDYMIQIIKAQEIGLKVDSKIKSEVAGLMNSTKSSLGLQNEKQFVNYVKKVFKITPGQLSKISENLMLIDEFKEAYLDKEYKPAQLTDEDVQAFYDQDTKSFDSVDIRYIHLSKLDDNGAKLSEDQVQAKKEKAEEALNKIRQGADLDQVITGYTEEKVDPESTKPVGSETVTYFTGSELMDWIFENKPGAAGMVETDQEIFVVKILSRTSFEDVKPTVRTTMENEAKESFYNEALGKWNMEAKYNIIKNDRIYDSISYK